MASLTTDEQEDNERFSDIMVGNVQQRIDDNKAKREKAAKRKGSPTPRQDDGTTTQEQKRAKSPPPTVVSPTPPFIREAHDANASNPPTPAKKKAAKEEAAKARPKKPESGQNLFGGDVPLAQLPPLPKRQGSFDWDPDTERIGFDDIGADPFDLPTISSQERDSILDATDKPSPDLDSFRFDDDLGILEEVAKTQHDINEIVRLMGEGVISEEEGNIALDKKEKELKVSRDMEGDMLTSLKNYREKPCTVAKKGSFKKLTDRINIKF